MPAGPGAPAPRAVPGAAGPLAAATAAPAIPVPAVPDAPAAAGPASVIPDPAGPAPGKPAPAIADPDAGPAPGKPASARPVPAGPAPVIPDAAAAYPDAAAGVSEAGAAVAPSITPATSAGQNDVGVAVTAGPARVIMAPRAASSGRCFGSLARQPEITSRSLSGTEVRSGRPVTTRYSTDAALPPPTGALPLAANASTQPSENTSLAGPTCAPSACSGDM